MGPAESQRIETITEELAKAGKANDVLDALRQPIARFYNGVCHAAAVGLQKNGRDTEALVAIEHIEESNAKFAALVAVGSQLLESKRVDSARKIFEGALTLHQQGKVASFDYTHPHVRLAQGLLHVGEVDKAIQFARSFEPKRSGSQIVRPLATLAIDMAKNNMPDKAYAASKDIASEFERYHALGAIAVAFIKSKQPERAKEVQAEVLAGKSGIKQAQITLYRLEVEFSINPLPDITRAFAEAGLFDEARKSALEIPANERSKALEDIAKEMIKADKVADALGVFDKNNETSRSRSLGNLVEWLFTTDKGDKIPVLLPHIEYGDDKSVANASLAKWQARSGLLRLARQTAESCWSPPHQLNAYTFILMEYARKRNPDLAARLEKERAARQ